MLCRDTYQSTLLILHLIKTLQRRKKILSYLAVSESKKLFSPLQSRTCKYEEYWHLSGPYSKGAGILAKTYYLRNTSYKIIGTETKEIRMTENMPFSFCFLPKSYGKGTQKHGEPWVQGGKRRRKKKLESGKLKDMVTNLEDIKLHQNPLSKLMAEKNK